MDRNRCYTWSMAPLTAPPFAFYSLRCSQTQNKGMRLYDSFLKRLSGGMMNFRLADTNAMPGSFKMSFKSQLRDFYDNFSYESKQWIKTNIYVTGWLTSQILPRSNVSKRYLIVANLSEIILIRLKLKKHWSGVRDFSWTTFLIWPQLSNGWLSIKVCLNIITMNHLFEYWYDLK